MKVRSYAVVCCLLLSFSGVVNAEGADLLADKKGEIAPSALDKSIALDYTQKNDKKIETRLNQIYAELDDLRGIKVTVKNSIATLRGEVDSGVSMGKAVKLANQIEDIVEVQNAIEVNQELKKRLLKTANKFVNMGMEAVASLPMLLLAIGIFTLFWWAGRTLSNQQKLYRRIAANHFIADLLGLFVHIVFIVLGLVFALSLLDATALLGTILGAAGIFGLAIGFAVRDTVENFIASVLLSIRNPFEVNDVVEIEGQEGRVFSLTTRATHLISLDGNHIRIPNAKVFKSIIVNYSQQPERRFRIEVSVDSGEDLSNAQALLFSALKNQEGVLDKPAPKVIVDRLGDSRVLIIAFAWVNQVNNDFSKVRSESIKAIKQALDDAGVVMPNSIYEVMVSKKDQSSPSAGSIHAKSQIPTSHFADTTTKTDSEVPISEVAVEQGGENLLGSGANKEI